MRRTLKTSLALALIALVFAAVGTNDFFAEKTQDIKNYIASVFFIDSITTDDLRVKYSEAFTTGKKVRILVVPGHEPNLGGAEYLDLVERDMTLALARKLTDDLKADSHFEVTMARDENGWNSDILSYFATNAKDIQNFTKSKKTEMKRLVAVGKVSRVSDGVMHGTAVPEVATHLFGINKWANDNNIDVMVHIHFNNYPRRYLDLPGDYRGFTIYIPDAQYSNAAASKTLATSVFKRLSNISAVSNLPKEDVGVVGDQDLIALGTSNTVDGASILIEYGYIYEPQYQNAVSRERQYSDLAKQTYLGIQDFFDRKN